MRYQLRSDQFCALANDAQWHNWLSITAPDLSKRLKDHLKNSKSCRSNKEVMHIIRAEISKRNLNKDLISFLRRAFPLALKAIVDETPKRESQPPQKSEDLNKHKIFKSYKPLLLTFPHKIIIVDDNPETLRKTVRKFLKTKIYSDTIIVEDRAYVEYFESRYKKEAEQIKEHDREIYQYRRRMGKDKV